MTSHELEQIEVAIHMLRQLSHLVDEADRKGLNPYDHIARNVEMCGVRLLNRKDSPLHQLLSQRFYGDQKDFRIADHKYMSFEDGTRLRVPSTVATFEEAWSEDRLSEYLSPKCSRSLGLHLQVIG